MVWNAVIFKSDIQRSGMAMAVFENFTQGAAWSIETPDYPRLNHNPNWTAVFDRMANIQQQAEKSELTQLSLEEWYQNYVIGLSMSSVILVVDPADFNPTDATILKDRVHFSSSSSVRAWYNLSYLIEPIHFKCDGQDRCGHTASRWVPMNPVIGDQGNAPVRSCFQEPRLNEYHVKVVPSFLVLVIICNVIKISSYLATLWITQTEPPLCTIGDAIQSFIQEPDIILDEYDLVEEPSTLSAIITANLPQFAMSYIYLGLNNAVSSILAMKEWCGYSLGSSKPSKGLRVTKPAPNTAQRSSYFLSVPYKWRLPIMAVMAVAHWLVSEIVTPHQLEFVLQFTPRSSPMNRPLYSYESNIQWFLNMMVYALAADGFLCFMLIGLCFLMKFPGGIPLAGCCSASKAAACRPTGFDGKDAELPPDLAFQELKWGVVPSPSEATSGIGHATFSTEVSPLEAGKRYV
ncbi:hypothetical protein N7470_004454 [Penicillium chermesinum]|nr:hypothetical protein N7470_004454 [Penicillium chermesinum]